jgi:hypothetical protein
MAKSVITRRVAVVECSRSPEVPVILKLAVPVGVSGTVVETVSVEVTALVPGVTVLGENAHDVAAGRSEHESNTTSSNEAVSGLMVTM